MGAAAARPVPAKVILAFVAACAIAKVFAAWATGFTRDEAYTVVIARKLALSYFDHPPLHQWTLHGFTAVFGEGWWVRTPFLLMAVAINAPLYGLTRRLFGPNAALWALFSFNAAAYFVVWPDGLILPDTPLFLFLVAAIWAVAEILFGPPRSEASISALWLAAGLAFGFAGLSKYSAVFAPLSLFGFLVFSPRHRHWLWRPQPYLGAALALAIFAPALVWNYQNHWASFAFQSGRAAKGLTFDAPAFEAFGQTIGAQIALLSPWIGAPLVIALADAARSRDANSASRFLLWLAMMPLLFFLLMPFFGKLAIPHWFNTSWLFGFPLLGQWLSERSARWLRAWAGVSAVLAAAIFTVYVAYVTVGPAWLLTNLGARLRDPAAWSYNWRGLEAAAVWRASSPALPAFVAVDNWRAGGKAGVALGPEVPVCAFSQDPREFAFVCDTGALVGQDALIVTLKENTERSLRTLAPYFKRLGPSQEIAAGRGEGAERILTLTRGYALLRPYPSPYADGGAPQ